MSAAQSATVPMRIVLLAYRNDDADPYPYGQMRMINAGLYRRGLIEFDGSLTDAGRAIADEVAAQVKRGEWAEVVKP